jgi:hypothetical protein
MRLKANVPIVINSRRCGQKNDLAVGTKHRLGQRNELGANALFLKIYVNGKIGKITGVIEVRYRPSNANEEILTPARGDDVRMVQHPPETVHVADRSSFGQGRAKQQTAKFVHGNGLG